MIHSCKIIKDTGTTQNAAGSHIPNLVSSDSKCLFSKSGAPKNYISDANAGKIIFNSTLVFLPVNVEIAEGDYVSTTEPHWEGTYEVQKVDAPGIPADHIEASLTEVKKRE